MIAKGYSKEILALTEKIQDARSLYEVACLKAIATNKRLYTKLNKLQDLKDGFFSFLKSAEIYLVKEEVSRLEDKNEEDLLSAQNACDNLNKLEKELGDYK